MRLAVPVRLLGDERDPRKRVELRRLAIAEVDVALEFEDGRRVLVALARAPGDLLAETGSFTSRRYMLLKRLLSHMLFYLETMKVRQEYGMKVNDPDAGESVYRLKGRLAEFQAIEIIDRISLRDVVALWTAISASLPVPRARWTGGKGLEIDE